MRSRHQNDLLDLVERIVADTEEAGEKTVILNTKAARALLELAKLAPKPRGHPSLSGRAKIQRRAAVDAARINKRKLVAQGMRKELAHEKAAIEASNGHLRSCNLSISTIMRMMEGRRRR